MTCIIILNEKVVAELPRHPWRWSASTVLFCPWRGVIWARFYLTSATWPHWLVYLASSEGQPARYKDEVPGSLIWPWDAGLPTGFPRALAERELLIHAEFLRKQGVLP